MAATRPFESNAPGPSTRRAPKHVVAKMTAPTGSMSIGVVLSAGGLRGAAHLGVLDRLTQAGMPIDSFMGEFL